MRCISELFIISAIPACALGIPILFLAQRSLHFRHICKATEKNAHFIKETSALPQRVQGTTGVRHHAPPNAPTARPTAQHIPEGGERVRNGEGGGRREERGERRERREKRRGEREEREKRGERREERGGREERDEQRRERGER